MKLEPVYLLPAEPDRRICMSRRAFAGTLLGAVAASASCGYGFARFFAPASPKAPDESDSRGRETSAGATRNEATPDGDARLRWAHALADGPTTELCAKAPIFIAACGDWPDDTKLQDAVARLADFVIADANAPNRSVAAGVLLRHFVRYPATDPVGLARIESLRRVLSR